MANLGLNVRFCHPTACPWMQHGFHISTCQGHACGLWISDPNARPPAQTGSVWVVAAPLVGVPELRALMERPMPLPGVQLLQRLVAPQQQEPQAQVVGPRVGEVALQLAAHLGVTGNGSPVAGPPHGRALLGRRDPLLHQGGAPVGVGVQETVAASPHVFNHALNVDGMADDISSDEEDGEGTAPETPAVAKDGPKVGVEEGNS